MGMNGKWKEKNNTKISHFRHSEFLFFLFSVVKIKCGWQEREEKRDKHKWLVFSFHDFAWNSFIWIFISLFHFFSFHSQGPYSFWHYLNGFFFLHFRFFTSLHQFNILSNKNELISFWILWKWNGVKCHSIMFDFISFESQWIFWVWIDCILHLCYIQIMDIVHGSTLPYRFFSSNAFMNSTSFWTPSMGIAL